MGMETQKFKQGGNKMKIKFAKCTRRRLNTKSKVVKKNEEKEKAKRSWDYKQTLFLNKRCR